MPSPPHPPYFNSCGSRPQLGITSAENLMDFNLVPRPPSSSAASWRLDIPSPRISLTVCVRTTSDRAVSADDQELAAAFASQKLADLDAAVAAHTAVHWWLAHDDLLVHVYDPSSRRLAGASHRASVPAGLKQLERQLAEAASGRRGWSPTECREVCGRLQPSPPCASAAPPPPPSPTTSGAPPICSLSVAAAHPP